MPHTKSAKKALRQTEKRRDRNRVVKKAMRVQIKKFLATLKEGSPEQRQAEFNLACKRVDKAAARNVIHKNAAGRKKAQLALMLAGANAK